MCKFGCAGKWPDDLQAYKVTKAAMGVQLADTLQSSHGLHARAGMDCIDILADGFAFRLLLHSSRWVIPLFQAQSILSQVCPLLIPYVHCPNPQLALKFPLLKTLRSDHEIMMVSGMVVGFH